MTRENHDRRTDLYDKAVHFTAFEDYDAEDPGWKESGWKGSYRPLTDHEDEPEPEPEYHVCNTCGRMADDYENMPAMTVEQGTRKSVMRDEKGEIVRKCNNCRAAGE